VQVNAYNPMIPKINHPAKLPAARFDSGRRQTAQNRHWQTS